MQTTELTELMTKIAKDVYSLYPEAVKVYLVGSYARGEAKLSSDIDILICFPIGTDAWEMINRGDILWERWNEKTVGKLVDFLVYVEGGSRCGQYNYRELSGLPNPEILLEKI